MATLIRGLMESVAPPSEVQQIFPPLTIISLQLQLTASNRISPAPSQNWNCGDEEELAI